jgi:phosphate acetyltransferase
MNHQEKGLLAKLKAEVKGSNKRVVFPEGTEERILRAAALIAEKDIALPIVLGSQDTIVTLASNAGLNISKISTIDPVSSPMLDDYVTIYSRTRSIPSGAASRILKKTLYFGAMMVKRGEADAMVVGVDHATEDVIMASELIIGLEEGISTPSSFFVMDIPGYLGSQGSLLIFADAAMNPEPNADQLAEITITTAKSAIELLDWEPRVALLSFSTMGSAAHPLVDKVVKAVELAKERAPGLAIDGELQADAALIPEIATLKIERGSSVAGTANILIFPDLNAANIAYKLVQRLTGAKAYGPILQGFAKPVSDLSRGASIEDILGAVIIVIKRVEAHK